MTPPIPWTTIKKANTIQLKNWLFSIGSYVYPEVKKRGMLAKNHKVYNLAKSNVGVCSLIFGDQKMRNESRFEKNGLLQAFTMSLSNSLLNDLHDLRFPAHNIQGVVAPFIHEEHMRYIWMDVTTNMKEMTAKYNRTTIALAKEIFQTEQMNLLPILSDILEDECNADAEAYHFRSTPYCSLACPVLTRIRGAF